MKDKAKFSGIFGLVLFCFGVFAYLIVGKGTEELIIAHIVIGLLAIAFWLYLSGLSGIRSFKGLILERQSRFALNFTLSLIFFGALLVFVNYLALRFNHRLDLTQSGVFSLAEQSQTLIKNLKKPLKITALTGNQELSDEALKELLERYRYYNKELLSIKYINPLARPDLLKQLALRAGDKVHLRLGEGDNAQTVVLRTISEEAITAALLKLLKKESRKLYYLSGYGEPALEADAPFALGELYAAAANEKLMIEPLTLRPDEAVPGDGSALLLIAPHKALDAAVQKQIIEYHKNGGNLGIFVDPVSHKSLKELVKTFDVAVLEAIIVDYYERQAGGKALAMQMLAKEYAAHPITAPLKERAVNIFNIAAPLKLLVDGDNKGTFSALVKSSSTAWGEKDVKTLIASGGAKAERDSSDYQGPLVTAIARESGKDAGGRLVVFGDSDWLLNANLKWYANRDLALNTLNWLAGDSGSISIRPRQFRNSLATISRQSFVWILTLSFIVPELLLLLGLFIWWNRRRRQ